MTEADFLTKQGGCILYLVKLVAFASTLFHPFIVKFGQFVSVAFCIYHPPLLSFLEGIQEDNDCFHNILYVIFIAKHLYSHIK